jgi:hypothetical protein
LPTKGSGYIDAHVHPPTREFLIEAGGRYVEVAAHLGWQDEQLAITTHKNNVYIDL